MEFTKPDELEKTVKIDKSDIFEPLNKCLFKKNPSEVYNLDTLILLYNNGVKWRAIHIDIMKKYRVLYDTYHVSNDMSFKVSITYCPYSNSAVMYPGEFAATGYLHNGNTILVNDSEEYLSQIDGLKYIKEDNVYLQKWEVHIMSLRYCFGHYQDVDFFISDEKNKHNKEYLSAIDKNDKDKKYVDINNGCGILYYSIKNKDLILKTSLITSKSNNLANINKYISESHSDLGVKNAFIIYCKPLVFARFYPDSKVIRVK